MSLVKRTMWLWTLILVVSCGVAMGVQRTENFDTDPGWSAVNATFGQNNFGYQTSNFAGGAAAGEAGGQFARSGQFAYYADDNWSGVLTLEDSMTATGKFSKTAEGDADSRCIVGFFNTQDKRIALALYAADGGRMFVTAEWPGGWAQGVVAGAPYSFGDLMEFTLTYDPDTLYGQLTLNVHNLTTDDTDSLTVDITEAARTAGATFDAYGMMAGAGLTFGRFDQQYLDDVTYTVGFSYTATGPDPDDTDVDVSRSTGLSWTKAGGVTTQKVYFGTNPLSLSLVDTLDGSANSVDNATLGGELAGSTPYYWRVDSAGVDEDGVPYTDTGAGAGDVWSFTTVADTGVAVLPFPYDGAKVVVRENPTLSWQPYAGVTSHNVYFGPASGSLSLKGNTPDASFTLSETLDPNGAYNWRVDSLFNGGSIVETGPVWTFNAGTTNLEAQDFLSDPTGVTWSDYLTKGDSGSGNDFGYVNSGMVYGQAGEFGGTVRVSTPLVWAGRAFQEITTATALEASGQFQVSSWPGSNTSVHIGHYNRVANFFVGFVVGDNNRMFFSTASGGLAYLDPEDPVYAPWEIDVTYNFSYIYDPNDELLTLDIEGGTVDFTGTQSIPADSFSVDTFGIITGYWQNNAPTVMYLDNVTYTVGDDLTEGLFPNPMDFNDDDIVDLLDFSEFIQQWLVGRIL